VIENKYANEKTLRYMKKHLTSFRMVDFTCANYQKVISEYHILNMCCIMTSRSAQWFKKARSPVAVAQW
jgi:hypothetical protein